MEKFYFSIEDAKLIEDRKNSSFSVLRIDFFASGANKHETYISEETLKRTASTIYNCPLVWKYDPIMDDIYTHDPQETPCGFIPSGSEIEFKPLEDGRTMLSTLAYVWKRYSGRFLDFFKRDGDKPVSVEISVYETEKREDGSIELLDYMYEAVTVLGSFVTPAIPDASASVVRFASEEKSEYEKIYRKEFSTKYDDINFSIPKKVKVNAQKGLELYRTNGKGGTSLSLATARYLVKNEVANPEKIRNIFKYFERHKGDDIDGDPTSDAYISGMLWGGSEAYKWSKHLIQKMSEIDDRRMSYFEEKHNSDFIDKFDDGSMKNNLNLSVEKSEENIKEVYTMEDEKDKKAEVEEEKQEDPKEEQTESPDKEKQEEKQEDKQEEKQEQMSEETPADEAKEDPKEEATETPAEEKQENMGMDAYLEVAELLAMLQGDDGAMELCAEIQKGDQANMGKVVSGMFAQMRKMQDQLKQAGKEGAEMAALKEFKANVEAQQKEFAVNSALKEVEGVLPEDKISEFRKRAESFSLETIAIWENEVNSEAFKFSKGKMQSDGVTRVGFPFGETKKKTESLWG